MVKTKRGMWIEPYRIKAVTPLTIPTREERKKLLQQAEYNVFLLDEEHVYIDLLTDSGVNAMSDRQWSLMTQEQETALGKRGFDALQQLIDRHYNYPWSIPLHQGRTAEQLLARMCIKKGQVVLNNIPFITTRLHQEFAGAQSIDIVCSRAYDPNDAFPFKGNIDLAKLKEQIEKRGAENIAYVSMETNVNALGGQPFSLSNLQAVFALCQQEKIALFLDATRAIENAYFIQQREKQYCHWSIEKILKTLCSHSSGCTLSLKKEGLSPTGGIFACRDEFLHQRASKFATMYMGRLSERDMVVSAQGLRESLREEQQRARIGQIEYLGKQLLDAKIPLVSPIGSHAIFLNVDKIVPHIPQNFFPAQALAAFLYLEGGIRAKEYGSITCFAQSSKKMSPFHVVRLAIPRRVYTQTHLDIIAETVIETYRKRKKIQGLKQTKPHFSSLAPFSCFTLCEA